MKDLAKAVIDGKIWIADNGLHIDVGGCAYCAFHQDINLLLSFTSAAQTAFRSYRVYFHVYQGEEVETDPDNLPHWKDLGGRGVDPCGIIPKFKGIDMETVRWLIKNKPKRDG